MLSTPTEYPVTIPSSDTEFTFSIDPILSFSNRNINVDFNAVKGIFDTNGNLLHEYVSKFKVRHFIYYPDIAQKLISIIAKISNICLI
jgi:hypothetical protein